jgi:sulfoxide reductase heme-binding subunit YedZ
MRIIVWRQKLMKLGTFVACLMRLVVLARNALTNNLGANPIDAITDQTGIWTLRFLFITLTVTPVRRLSGWNRVIQLRRMLGLFAFFYGALHFVTYVWLDQFFIVQEMIADVLKRPFITVGFLSFVLLIPLAITSTTKMIKRLGGKWWQRLHRVVYGIAIGGVLHYLWRLLALLLGYRLWIAHGHRLRFAPIRPGMKGASKRSHPRCLPGELAPLRAGSLHQMDDSPQ